MSMEDPTSPQSFSTGRRWFIGFHVLLAVAAFAAIVGMTNYLGIRHFVRYNVSGTEQDKLSPVTKQVLGALTNDVRVIAYFDPDHPLFPYVKSMLQEYASTSRFVKVETVNYLTEPAKALQVLADYRLPQDSKDLVIFAANGRMEYVNQGELSDLDMNELLQGKSKEVKRKAFKGEMYFTSKILSVSIVQQNTAYYLLGHEEHKPQLEDGSGFKKFIELLVFNNVKVNELDLLRGSEVPADCDLLIIAGPQKTINDSELEKISRYLSQGGRLLFLAHRNMQAGPERILGKWGIDLGNNGVEDKKNALENRMLTFDNFGTHQIVQPLAKNKLIMAMFMPRTVRALAGANQQADSAKVTDLISTGPDGIAYTDFKNGSYYPSSSDLKGVLPVAVAVEKGGLRGVKLERGTTRIVACGDSYFLANSLIIYPGNEEFARQSLNWLLGRSIMLNDIGPRSFTEYTMVVTDSQMVILRWILLGAFPGAVFGFGLLVYLRRQR